MEINKSLRVCLLVSLCLSLSTQSSFDCTRFDGDLMDDSRAKAEIAEALTVHNQNFDIK